MTNVQWQLTLIVLTLLLTTGCAIPGSTDPLALLGMVEDPDSAKVVLVRDGEPAATIVTAQRYTSSAASSWSAAVESAGICLCTLAGKQAQADNTSQIGSS